MSRFARVFQRYRAAQDRFERATVRHREAEAWSESKPLLLSATWTLRRAEVELRAAEAQLREAELEYQTEVDVAFPSTRVLVAKVPA